MNKPQSLRHALNKAVPYVRNNPDKLHLFVDNGSLVATGASSMSWEYRYTLNVVIEDFSGDQNLLMAPVLLWLRDNQPDAINNPALREKLFTFEVDILRNDVCDISLKRSRAITWWVRMKTCWYLIALMPTGATPNERRKCSGNACNAALRHFRYNWQKGGQISTRKCL